MHQNGHEDVTELSLTDMVEDVASAAPHLGSVLSADLDELPKGELTGEACKIKDSTPTSLDSPACTELADLNPLSVCTHTGN